MRTSVTASAMSDEVKSTLDWWASLSLMVSHIMIWCCSAEDCSWTNSGLLVPSLDCQRPVETQPTLRAELRIQLLPFYTLPPNSLFTDFFLILWSNFLNFFFFENGLENSWQSSKMFQRLSRDDSVVAHWSLILFCCYFGTSELKFTFDLLHIAASRGIWIHPWETTTNNDANSCSQGGEGAADDTMWLFPLALGGIAASWCNTLLMVSDQYSLSRERRELVHCKIIWRHIQLFRPHGRRHKTASVFASQILSDPPGLGRHFRGKEEKQSHSQDWCCIHRRSLAPSRSLTNPLWPTLTSWGVHERRMVRGSFVLPTILPTITRRPSHHNVINIDLAASLYNSDDRCQARTRWVKCRVMIAEILGCVQSLWGAQIKIPKS